MVRPLGGDGIGGLLHLGQTDSGRLADGEGGRGLGNGAADVHLLGSGQLHGLLLGGPEDTSNQGAPRPAVPSGELDRAAKRERTGNEKRV